MSFLVQPFQGVVYFLKLRRKHGKISAYIGSHFLATVDTLVFLNVQCDFFGYCVVMAKKTAAERAELGTIVGENFFHV